ncbi:MAG: hypothetical protein V2A66_11310 [Pseudomonadota bacterium]
MPNWSEMQARARKLINEGLEIVKTGAHEAGFLAETTASAARLKMDEGKNRLEMYRSLYVLGAEIYEAMKRNPGATTLAITERIEHLYAQTKRFDDTARDDGRELDLFTVVKKAAPPSPSAGAGKAGKRQKRTAKKSSKKNVKSVRKSARG